MNITIKNTPTTMAIRLFGKDRGTQLSNIIKKRSPEESYEIIGMAYQNFDATIKKYATSNETYKPFQSMCFQKQIESEKITREALEFQPTIEDGIFQCGKCNCRKTLRTTLQTRSGDEGMTTYIVCAKCHHSWQEN